MRVEKPYELGVFLMHEKNQQLMDKLKYSMTADSLANRRMIVRNIKVDPQVSLYITYLTLIRWQVGAWQSMPISMALTR